MKNLFIFGFLLLFASASFAQDGLKIGVRFSPLVSFGTFIQDDDRSRIEVGQRSRLGYSYGIVGSYGFTENYGLNSGILITARGFRTELDDFTSDIRYTAIQIPFGFKLRSNEIATGLHLKAIFNAELEANVGYRGVTQTTGMDELESRNPNQMNFFTAGFVVGGGLQQVYDWGTLDVGLSFHRGLMNINDKDNAFADTILRLNYWSLDFSYYF